jgi:hypothetical protein
MLKNFILFAFFLKTCSTASIVTQFITTTAKLTTTTSPFENLDLFVMANGYVEGSAPPGVRFIST